ncbi:MAG: rhomboid family protein [Candidatus Methylacidiphilales bacterium]|nr:hypothetical protein [Candidatus Methylacidiphilales bacterium]
MPPPTFAPPSPPTGLSRQRCAYHTSREAVARCPECRRFYCRECVTEHDDRLLCASCLKKAAAREDEVKPSAAFAYIRSGLGVVLGFGVAWMFFAMLLVFLASLPTSFDFSETWNSPQSKPKLEEVEEKGN